MFRRSGIISKQARDLGVKFCDGCGIITSVERSARRLEAARAAAVLSMPRI